VDQGLFGSVQAIVVGNEDLPLVNHHFGVEDMGYKGEERSLGVRQEMTA